MLSSLHLYLAVKIFFVSLLLLVILPPPHSCADSLGVSIVRSPESTVAPKGDEVVFECELNLAPDRLEWRFRSTSFSGGNDNRYEYLNSTISNITNDDQFSKLRISVSAETLGDYQCVAWFGSAAIASNSARLTLASISIDNSNGYSRNPIRWNVEPKNCVLIRCGTVTSNPPPVWTFYRNGEEVTQKEVLPSSGALILNSVTSADSGNYSCSAMNSITGEEVKLPQRIDLRVDYTAGMPPYFLDYYNNSPEVTARPGETIVLECPGVGTPPPKSVWSSPNVNYFVHNRTKTLPYGLQIVDVIPEDEGSYVCRLDNGATPALVHTIKLFVLKPPKIFNGPKDTLINEGESLRLDCEASGYKTPKIYWLINGQDTKLDSDITHGKGYISIKRVQKHHAGIVQCFARNEIDEDSLAILLRVNATQIQRDVENGPLGDLPTRSSNTHHKGKKNRKNKPATLMIPPSRPNVTRLSDNAVMLRWFVPENNGMAIQFFKVQYRMLGDSSRKIRRENWQTTNEDIIFGKRSKGLKNFTSSVTGLKPDRLYRFRIIAVYINNDNKEGNTSTKFYLQRGLDAFLPAPELMRAEPFSETAILLHWTLDDSFQNVQTVEGFYAYYRLSSSAGDYLKVTVDGRDTRRYKIDMLEPGTTYEFKLQSFNEHTASNFSVIMQGKTLRPTTPPPPTSQSVKPTKPNEEDNSIYPVVAGAAGGGILLLLATIAACLCMKRRRNSQSEDEDKPQLDHIQADFVTPSVMGVSNHHKSGHRLNGVLPRMNITPNPLAQEADKNRNVMELRFMPKNKTSPQKTKKKSNNEDCTKKKEEDLTLPQRSSSSCETLEASEGVTNSNSNNTEANSPLSKPLPPLPNGKISTGSSSSTCSAASSNHTTPTINSKNALKSLDKSGNSIHHQHKKSYTTPSSHQSNHHTTTSNTTTTNNHHSNLNNSQNHHQNGLHHAQPYHPSAPGTPTLMHKRDYQHPPPVPPHQNNNHHQLNNMIPPHYNHHAAAAAVAAHHQMHSPYQAPPPPMTPSMEQQRRTLDRSARNLHYPLPDNMDATRIPSLRRTRRTSGNTANNNGGVGIPIVPGSPRVQRSPMPARTTMMKRNRLGSHNDNISSGSLNSIEV